MNSNTFPKTIGYVAENNPLVQYCDNLYQTAAPMTMEQLCSAMSMLLNVHFTRESVLSSPENTKSYLVSKLSGREQEVFSCIHRV